MKTVQVIQLPLVAGDTWPALIGPFPISETAWENMMDLLETMKPALVETQTDETPRQRAWRGPDSRRASDGLDGEGK